MKNCHVRSTLVLVLALCAEGLAVAQGAPAELAYVSLRAGDAHVFVRDADGAEHRVTQGRSVNLQPSLAADGRVAFVTLGDGRSTIHVLDRVGGVPRRLTTDERNETAPAWSPDASAIAFYSADPVTGRAELRIVELASGRTLNIAAPGASLGPARPDWSADGQRLLFIGADAKGRNQVWVVGRDGIGLRDVSSGFAARGAGWASLSPDGRRVAWVADLRGRTPVVVTDLATGESRDLMAGDERAAAEAPRWSPDGQRITFAANGDELSGLRNDIHVINADGSDRLNLSRHAAEDFDPRWTADGRRVVFASLRTGTSLLYEVPALGGPTRALAIHPSHDMDHVSRPVALAR